MIFNCDILDLKSKPILIYLSIALYFLITLNTFLAPMSCIICESIKPRQKKHLLIKLSLIFFEDTTST